MEIPQQLRRPEFRFCRIQSPKFDGSPSDGKKPIDHQWDEKDGSNFAFDHPLLLTHIENGGNYGVVCGFGNLVVIDADAPEIEEQVHQKLPQTFTVLSGKGKANISGRKHFYYLVDQPIETITISANGINLGHVKSWGGQVIAPGSTHQTKQKYLVINDVEIATVPAETIKETFAKFTTPKWEELEKEILTHKVAGETSEIDNIPIFKLFSLANFTKRGNEWQGSHPVHASTTGGNFCINTEKNLWHCFRHDTGGNALSWIAVRAGILQCEEAKAGNLRGDKFKAAVAYAEEAGLVSKHSKQPTAQVMPSSDFNVTPYSALKDLPEKEQDWLVEGLIPQGALVVIAGKAGSYKSMFSLAVAHSLNTSGLFLDKFKSSNNKPGILFIDEENPLVSVKKRLQWMEMDLGKDYPLFFLSMKGTDIAKEKWVKPIDAFLTAHPEIGIVVVDSLTRVAPGLDENEAGAINSILQPFRLRTATTGVTWIFLHHVRKTNSNAKVEEEPIDKIRGSTDIVNVSDVVMLFTSYKPAVGNGFTIEFVKMRNFELPKKMSVDAIWGENEQGGKTLSLHYVGDKELEDNITSKCINAIVKWAEEKPSFETKEVLSAFSENKAEGKEGLPARTVQRALKIMLDAGRAVKLGRGLYKLASSQKLISDEM